MDGFGGIHGAFGPEVPQVMVDVNEGKGGVGFRIESIWAFLGIHEDNDEGIVGVMMGDQWMPFIAADETRLRELRGHAQMIADFTGKPIVLTKFSVREDVERIEPNVERSE